MDGLNIGCRDGLAQVFAPRTTLAQKKLVFRTIKTDATAAHSGVARADNVAETSALRLDLLRNIQRMNAYLVLPPPTSVLRGGGRLPRHPKPRLQLSHPRHHRLAREHSARISASFSSCDRQLRTGAWVTA